MMRGHHDSPHFDPCAIPDAALDFMASCTPTGVNSTPNDGAAVWIAASPDPAATDR